MATTLKKELATVKLADIQAGSVIGGMRGMLGLVYETSKLHPVNGISYRGHDLFEIRKKAPTVPGGK